MKMKIPKYPNDFFSFADGVDIDNETINEWIESRIKVLEDNPHTPSSAISSGNTMVTVHRLDKTEGKYEINVTKNYSEAFIY